MMSSMLNWRMITNPKFNFHKNSAKICIGKGRMFIQANEGEFIQAKDGNLYKVVV